MTLFHEEKNALENTKKFLYSLLDPKQTPRVPRQVRENASRVLKHFPMMIDLFCENYVKEINEDRRRNQT